MSMWFSNEWYIIHNAIDKKTCDRIKNLGKDKWKESEVDVSYDAWYEEKQLVRQRPEDIDKEKMTYKDRVYKPNDKVRISDIHWITGKSWVHELIWPYMMQANSGSGWNLDINAAENIQLTRYQKGGFYEWHKDGPSDTLAAYDNSKINILHGNVRKISMSLILNDDFEGGNFEFCSYAAPKNNVTRIEANAGDMIFFTSGMEHRVVPVTKGERYSLVNWFVGPPIK